MKKFNIIALGALALFSLASCELSDELWGNSSDSTGDGAARVNVSTKVPVSMTRAETVSTDDFPVLIEHQTDVDVKKSYLVKELPNSIALPVGKYTVSAHTPGDLEKKMTAPYYAGSSEIEIEKGLTTKTDVVCKMKNSRIQVKYGTDFIAAFSEWTMTVDDGTNTAISYTQDDTDPAAVYYYFTENTVEKITVNISAKTVDGNTVSDSRTFKKANATEGYEEVSDYFGGGDAIVITMGAVGDSNGHITNITINTSITFENSSESVEIPVVIASLDMPSSTSYTIDDNNASTDMPEEANTVISTPAGLKSCVVKIEAGNTAFQTALSQLSGLDFTTGVDIVDNSTFLALIQETDATLTVPTANQTDTYTFPIAKFFTKLNSFGATDDGKAHKFSVAIVDNEGNTASGVYSVAITKKEAPATTEPTVTCVGKKNTDSEEGNVFETGVDYFIEAANYPTTDVVISTPAKLKSLKVTIVGGNEGFSGAVVDLNFTDRELVGDTELSSLLTELGVSLDMPVAGSTSYIFPVGTFYPLMNVYGPTVDADETKYTPDGIEYHQFKITVEDENGDTVTKELNVTIRK